MGRIKKKSIATLSPVFYPFFILLLNVIPVLHLNTIPDHVLMPRLLLVNLIVFGFYFYITIRKKQTAIDLSVIKNPVILTLSGLTLLTAMSLLWAINPGEGVFDLVKISALTILTFTIVQVLMKSDRWIYRLSQFVIITSFITAAIGYYQYLEYVLPDPDREIDKLMSALYLVTGIMGHKNQLSIALMLYLPFLIFGLLRFSNIWKVASTIALGLNLLLIFILETRSVWVGVLLGTAILLILSVLNHRALNISDKARKVFIGLIVTGVITIGGVVAFVVNSDGVINEKLETLTDPSNRRNVHRLNTWKMSMDMTLDNPLIGVGAGNWKIVAPAYHKDAGINIRNFNWIRPHNDFLWMLTEKGVVGFLLYGMVFFFAIRIAIRQIKREKNNDSRLFILLIVGGLAGYITVSMFSFPAERMHHQVYLAVYLAALIVLSHNSQHKFESGRFYKPAIVTILALTAFGSFYSIEMIRMERHLYKANTALNAEQWHEVIEHGKSARSILRNIDHDNIPVDWYLGMGYFKTGQFDLAVKHYKKAVAASPFNPVVLNNYGQLLVEAGKYNKAREVLEAVLELYTYHPEAIVNLSTCYYKLKKYRLAFKTLRQLKFRDRTPEIKNNIQVLKQLKDKQQRANQLKVKTDKQIKGK